MRNSTDRSTVREFTLSVCTTDASLAKRADMISARCSDMASCSAGRPKRRIYVDGVRRAPSGTQATGAGATYRVVSDVHVRTLIQQHIHYVESIDSNCNMKRGATVLR